MRRIKILAVCTTFCLFFIINNTASQTKFLKQYCGVADNVKSQVFEDKISKIIESNQATESNGGRLINSNGVIVIPVVFHILHHPSIPAQNVSQTNLDRLLDITNLDLSTINPLQQGTFVGEHPWNNLRGIMNVKLVRACIDPNGNPTNGIEIKQLPSPTTFVNVSVNAQGIEATTGLYPGVQLASLGGMDAWPNDKYLNIWVADINYKGLALYPGQRLGDITFPFNGNNITVPRASIDGLTISYSCFPEGDDILPDADIRIITHELGHWLGIYHLWEDGCPRPPSPFYPPYLGDRVDDTPPQNYKPSGCPREFPLSDQGPDACPESLVPGSYGIMYMNYMSYIFDGCKRLFTKGQVDRARRLYFNEDINVGNFGDRGPFINNYFGIKEPFTLQNNTLTVYLNNPACLDVNYSFTGPVTEISHDNQKIVFSVPCPSAGNVTVTATAANYIDDYAFTYNNTSNCQLGSWQKKYFWNDPDLLPFQPGDPSAVIKGKSGNHYFSFNSSAFSNNFNHTGPIPTINYGNFLMHFKPDGQTDWVRENLTSVNDIFIMDNGNLRTKISSVSPNYIYLDGVTGAITTGPLFIPDDEKILAETNSGAFITYKNGQVFLRTQASTTVVSQNVVYSFFNKNTNRLFIQESIDFTMPASGIITVYEITGNTLTSVPISLPQVPGQLLYHVDDNNNIYTLDMQCGTTPLYKYNFQTGNYSPLIITGFSNNNIVSFKTFLTNEGVYTSNSCLIIKPIPNLRRDTYFLDFANGSFKQILGTSNLIFSCEAAQGWGQNNYIIDNEDVYMSGNIYFGNDVTIGNNTITPLPPNVFRRFTNFLQKLNLQNDFSRQGFTSQAVQPFDEGISVQTSPVPAQDELLLEVKKKNNVQDLKELYVISVLDRMGNVIIEQKSISGRIKLSLAGLHSGVYIVNVQNKKGERASKVIIKQ